MSEFTVYGRPGCGYCYRAVELLESHGHEFRYIDIYRKGMSKLDVSREINQPVYTMPQIIHGENYVGGCRELINYLKMN